MISLTIGNSTSKLEGLDRGQFQEVRKILSYSIDKQAAFFSGFGSTKRYLISARGEFPTGLLYLVESWLKTKQNHKVIDTRLVPGMSCHFDPDFGDLEPYPEQWEAVIEAIENHRGVISIPTGVGKTIVAALIARAFQVPTLIVVPTLGLKKQITDKFLEWFGPTADIEIENVDALDPDVPSKAKLLIIDEFHHAAAKTYRKLNSKAWTGVYYRFGLTATPFRSDENERLLLESVLSQVIYRLEYSTAVEKGYIVPVEAYYVELPKIQTKANSWAAVYDDLVVNRLDRNKTIAALIQSLWERKKPTLCLVKELEHGEALNNLTGAAFTHGTHEERDQYVSWFNEERIRSLIGTVGVLGEGVDTKPAEYVIIAGLGKSKGQFLQQVGRGVRKYPGKDSCKVIIFYDSSHKYTKSHFQEQVKILKEYYGVKPVKI